MEFIKVLHTVATYNTDEKLHIVIRSNLEMEHFFPVIS